MSVKCIITGQTSTVTPTTDASDLTSGTLSSDRLPTVPVTKGGTGATSLTSNAILAGNSTSAVKTISTASGALYATSSSGAASFGTLPVAQGGTGKTTNTSNAILTGNGTSAINNVATASGALYATSSNGAAKFGTLPLAQGGTGQTSAAKALYGLINGSSAITQDDLEDGDYIGILDSSGSTGKKILVSDFLAGPVPDWEWGDENAIGDADWWAGLKANLSNITRSDYVGKTKLVSLSTSVLGATAAKMICIGADQDGSNTLTFQTYGGLPTSTVFSSSSAVWIGSTARTQCQNFYNYCSAKDSIKTVSKGTCPNISTSSSRSDAVTYNDETVWIPSEREMGLDAYSPLSVANSSTSKAECTNGYNAAYSYYNSNSRRIKYIMTADGTSVDTSTCYYWERSRDYGGSNTVCGVDASGGASASGYGGSFYLAPAFTIG